MSKYLLFLTGVGGWSGKDGPLVQIYNLFSNLKWTLHSDQHYENKFTKTFRPINILHIFTKF